MNIVSIYLYVDAILMIQLIPTPLLVSVILVFIIHVFILVANSNPLVGQRKKNPITNFMFNGHSLFC